MQIFASRFGRLNTRPSFHKKAHKTSSWAVWHRNLRPLTGIVYWQQSLIQILNPSAEIGTELEALNSIGIGGDRGGNGFAFIIDHGHTHGTAFAAESEGFSFGDKVRATAG